MEGRILIIDDDAGVRRVLDRILTGAGYEVEQAPDAFQALDLLDSRQPDAALLDIKMPGMDGFGLLDNLSRRGLEIPVVILTGHGDQFTAQECLDAGAAAYLTKPPDRADLLLTVRGAVAQGRVARELERIEEPPPLLGSSDAMGRLREEITRAAPTHATVLILGESGTGKELVARRLHHLSGRARKSFIRVNCAAIPEELIESELFGHEKGSFTGAHQRQVGKFVQADGGTIFLDEVGDMPMGLQAKLLRFLEEHTFRRVGGTVEISVDVRVIAATNREIERSIEEGKFRSDLMFRLNVIPIYLPPLRKRGGDVRLLTQHFVTEFAQEFRRPINTVDESAYAKLEGYAWPGNVRELRNVLERAVLLSESDVLTADDIVLGRDDPARHTTDGLQLALPPEGIDLREVEQKLMKQALARTKNNQTQAAKLLHLSRDAFRYRLEKLGLL